MAHLQFNTTSSLFLRLGDLEQCQKPEIECIYHSIFSNLEYINKNQSTTSILSTQPPIQAISLDSFTDMAKIYPTKDPKNVCLKWQSIIKGAMYQNWGMTRKHLTLTEPKENLDFCVIGEKLQQFPQSFRIKLSGK